MSSDPTTLETIGDLAAIIAVVAASLAAYFAFRSAGAATRSADAQTLPLLSDVPRLVYGDHLREIVLPGGELATTPISGDIRADHQSAWISLPVRNIGKGLALIEKVSIDCPGIPGSIDAAARAADRDQVQAGEEIRIAIGLAAVDPGHQVLAKAIAKMEPIIAAVSYTDFARRQKQTTHFQLGALRNDNAWRVTDLWTVREEGNSR